MTTKTKNPRHSLKAAKSFADAIRLGPNLLPADVLQAIPVGSLVKTAGGAMGLWVGLSPTGVERVVYNAGDLLKAWGNLKAKIGDGHTGRDYFAVERIQGLWTFYLEALALHDRILAAIDELEDGITDRDADRWAELREVGERALERAFNAEYRLQTCGVHGVRG